VTFGHGAGTDTGPEGEKMNEDILLTKDSPEIQVIVIGLEYGRISTDHDVIQAAIEEACRAQVRNVAKWMEQEGVVVHERQLGFVLPFQSWAALKAAGGEG
jgi:hypothetical protein